jgi:hypothetical protein
VTPPTSRWRPGLRHGKRAAMSPRSPIAGGFPIAAGALLGTAVGVALRQPTIGFLGGLALGGVLALAIWLRDRAR